MCQNDVSNANKTLKDDNETAAMRDVDVILLAGQSNAVGISNMNFLKTRYPDLFNKYRGGFDDVHISLLCDRNYSTGFTDVKFGQGYDNAYFGPELGIAAYFSETYPGKELYIIKCAFGATNINHWSPDDPDNKCYVQFIEHTDKSLKWLIERGMNPKIMAFCWMQGESDSIITRQAAFYGKQETMIKGVREYYAAYKKFDDILFVDATLNETCKFFPLANVINEQKRRFQTTYAYNVIVDTQILSITTNTESNCGDGDAHYDSESMIRLGKAFGRETFNAVEKLENKH